MQVQLQLHSTTKIHRQMSLQDLIGQFQFTRILKSDPSTKSVAVLGNILEQPAIVSIEKAAFNISSESTLDVNSLIEQVKLIQNNDIYFWSSVNLAQDLDSSPGAKLNLIYPATETHIKKFAHQQYHMIEETPQLYNSIVAPFIETQKGDRIQWVHNILYHGKEADSVLYHDKDPVNGFVLLPDMKWDRVSMEALYLMAIVQRTDIASLRDLNASHIEFLENLQSKAKKIGSEKYNVAEDEFRVFVHYQPSYYHFHVHLVRVSHPGLGDGSNVGKAVLLNDVIENLKLVPDYYQRRTLTYVLGENHKLWGLLQASEES